MLRRFVSIPAVGFLLVPACSLGQTLNDPALTRQTYATGLVQPTGIAFIPGSLDALAIEKASGQVRRVNAGGGAVSGNVLDLPVHSDSERGLLGIAFDPAFANNRSVYLYYSATSTGSDSTAGGTWLENRLSRFTLNPGGTALTGETVLATFGSAADGQAQGANHDGGPLVFGPDGFLYGVTGDLNRSQVEQNQNTGNSTFVGGVYRVDKTTGAAAPGNPFSANANPDLHRWFAYGVRNSFGMAFDPVNGNLWDTENGPDVMDEINLVAPGFNSGWSQIMGPDSRDAQNAPGDLVVLPGSSYSDPEFSFASPIGITAIEFLSDSFLDDYDDAVIVGNNNLGTMHVLRLNAARDGFVLSGGLTDLVADDEAERNALQFGSGFGPTTDLEVGPDGALYAVSYSTGIIHRIVPEPGALGLFGAATLSVLWRRRRL
jgi:aldose sugar dehydrogenase